jgi:branched-chain amino acid aminotransferase
MILGKARESGFENIYLRMSLKPEATPVIVVKEITPYPEDLYLYGVRAGFVPTRRIHPEVQNPRIKSSDFLTNILARIEADQRGLFEGLMCDSRGFIAEGTISNIFIVQNGGLKTPPTVNILKGITRDVAIELASRLGIEVHEKMFTRYDAYVGEEAFLTYTSAGIVPVVEIDGRAIGDGTPGPLTKKLMKRYKEILKEESIPI